MVFYVRMDGLSFACYLVGKEIMSCTSLIKEDYYITSVRLSCTIWALGHLLQKKLQRHLKMDVKIEYIFRIVEYPPTLLNEPVKSAS